MRAIEILRCPLCIGSYAVRKAIKSCLLKLTRKRNSGETARNIVKEGQKKEEETVAQRMRFFDVLN